MLDTHHQPRRLCTRPLAAWKFFQTVPLASLTALAPGPAPPRCCCSNRISVSCRNESRWRDCVSASQMMDETNARTLRFYATWLIAISHSLSHTAPPSLSLSLGLCLSFSFFSLFFCSMHSIFLSFFGSLPYFPSLPLSSVPSFSTFSWDRVHGVHARVKSRQTCSHTYEIQARAHWDKD